MFEKSKCTNAEIKSFHAHRIVDQRKPSAARDGPRTNMVSQTCGADGEAERRVAWWASRHGEMPGDRLFTGRCWMLANGG